VGSVSSNSRLHDFATIKASRIRKRAVDDPLPEILEKVIFSEKIKEENFLLPQAQASTAALYGRSQATQERAHTSLRTSPANMGSYYDVNAILTDAQVKLLR
jgi:hypothetical protein